MPGNRRKSGNTANLDGTTLAGAVVRGANPAGRAAAYAWAMGFSGWRTAALEFYEGLESDNSKAYWTKHKATYTEQVLRPMEELLDELAPEFGPPKIFRPYRDVRFSHDKTPYKTHIGAVLGGTGYVQLSADGLSAGPGGGIWSPTSWSGTAPRSRARTAPSSPPSWPGLNRTGVEIHGHGTLKTAPRGYTADHPRIGLLRHKGLTTWRHWNPAPWLCTPAVAGKVVELFRTSAAFCDWLNSHIDR